MAKTSGKVTIKKYANRRLYDTESSSYITLDRLAELVREGREFEVVDAKSGEDITRHVLTQIIVDEESRGSTMLPVNFLKQLIGLYGNSVQGVVPQYLEAAMDSFKRNQQAIGDAFGGNTFADIAKRNMAMFEDASRVFKPGTGKGRDRTGRRGREIARRARRAPGQGRSPRTNDVRRTACRCADRACRRFVILGASRPGRRVQRRFADRACRQLVVSPASRRERGCVHRRGRRSADLALQPGGPDRVDRAHRRSRREPGDGGVDQLAVAHRSGAVRGDARTDRGACGNRPLLDAIALSRGKFAISALGAPAVAYPNWGEPLRVIEDCRL